LKWQDEQFADYQKHSRDGLQSWQHNSYIQNKYEKVEFMTGRQMPTLPTTARKQTSPHTMPSNQGYPKLDNGIGATRIMANKFTHRTIPLTRNYQ